jgi:hypothetical protein
MVRRAIAARRVIELTGLRAQDLHQLRHAAHRHVVTDQKHQRGIGHQHDGRKVLHRVIAQAAFEGRHRAMGAGGDYDQRVAVGRSLLCGHDPEDAGRPGAIIHDGRPSVLRADPLGDEPRNAVVGSASRIGNDDANRLCRVWLAGGTRPDLRRDKERRRNEELGC